MLQQHLLFEKMQCTMVRVKYFCSSSQFPRTRPLCGQTSAWNSSHVRHHPPCCANKGGRTVGRDQDFYWLRYRDFYSETRLFYSDSDGFCDWGLSILPLVSRGAWLAFLLWSPNFNHPFHFVSPNLFCLFGIEILVQFKNQKAVRSTYNCP